MNTSRIVKFRFGDDDADDDNNDGHVKINDNNEPQAAICVDDKH